MQAGAPQFVQAVQRITRHQQFQHFVEQPCLRDVGNQRRQLKHWRPGGRLHLERQFRRKPGRAQHAHRILPVAGGRVTDHPDDFVAHVGHAVMKVENLIADRVVGQRVDREIPTGGIIGLRPPDIVTQHATVIVGLGIGLQ